MVVFVCICFPPIPGAKLQIYEDGFHSSILVNKNGREALGFLKLLKLDDEVVSANIEASARRHLLHRGHVSLVPGPQHVLLYGPAFLAEPLWPRSKEEDESVYDFVKRRGSKSLALRLADPICRGQLVGNAKELSVRSSFPRLWHNEKRFGSVFLGVSTLGRSHESLDWPYPIPSIPSQSTKAALSTISAYRQRSWMALDLLDTNLYVNQIFQSIWVS